MLACLRRVTAMQELWIAVGGNHSDSTQHTGNTCVHANVRRLRMRGRKVLACVRVQLNVIFDLEMLLTMSCGFCYRLHTRPRCIWTNYSLRLSGPPPGLEGKHASVTRTQRVLTDATVTPKALRFSLDTLTIASICLIQRIPVPVHVQLTNGVRRPERSVLEDIRIS
ncbi:hypothetical protein BGX38DRAFT_538308 [Terfezia claveryi]|nr:hypothetical protein BGX38DRAFT_538308 [Terfezia claveryi]